MCNNGCYKGRAREASADRNDWHHVMALLWTRPSAPSPHPPNSTRDPSSRSRSPETHGDPKSIAQRVVSGSDPQHARHPNPPTRGRFQSAAGDPRSRRQYLDEGLSCGRSRPLPRALEITDDFCPPGRRHPRTRAVSADPSVAEPRRAKTPTSTADTATWKPVETASKQDASPSPSPSTSTSCLLRHGGALRLPAEDAADALR